MSLHSLTFLTSFVAVWFVYWFLLGRAYKFQTAFLVLANLAFYYALNRRFVPLLVVSVAFDYGIALAIQNSAQAGRRKAWLLASIALNLGVLVYFKYTNFFLDTFGGSASSHLFRTVAIPVGISFFTFLKVGYIIDVYRRQTAAMEDPVTFFAFMTFFPLIVSGPIERSDNLLAQMSKPRTFDDQLAREGLRRYLSGLIKKMVIADNLGIVVDTIFKSPQTHTGIELAAGAFLFAIQIYCDFAGYTDMALGIANLLGFRPMNNFLFPYFSRDIGEFWRRWHISLSSWFRDYLFYPLGAGYKGKARWMINLFITFGLCGLWHGADWHYIAWGLLIGIYFIPLVFRNENVKRSRIPAKGRLLPSRKEFFQMASTFILIVIADIFFRAESIGAAFNYFSDMFTTSWLVMPRYGLQIATGVLFLAFEWLQRGEQHTFAIGKLPMPVRWSFYCVALIALLVFGNFSTSAFLYADF